MKRSNRKANPWEDHYTRKARQEHYPARSVYKLKEIQSKFRIIQRGDRILDLGCAPGSWLLYAASVTGEKGRVLGIDLTPVSPPLPAHVSTIAGDIFCLDEQLAARAGGGFDVVLSDMAPATTGSKHVDAARSFALCQKALELALGLLLPGGRFVCKIFQGEDFKAFADQVKAHFDRQQIFKPQSSRKASKEIFVIGLGRKKPDLGLGRPVSL
jgi:23S rRNA (uridine2552-2'-O)-methyltransferase